MNGLVVQKASPVVGDGILLLTALLWGSGFIAQRLGNEHMGPLAFNGARFLLAGVLLFPWTYRWLRSVYVDVFTDAQKVGTAGSGVSSFSGLARKERIQQISLALLVVGFLTTGATLQQVGLVTTSAGKAGFLTSLYVVFVAFLGLFVGRRPQRRHWLGAGLAVAGAYFLSVTKDLHLSPGDLAVTVGAVAWASHILSVDRALGSGIPALALAGFQFLVCGVVSLGGSFALEREVLAALAAGWKPIVYSGGIVVALGYSMQIIGQRVAPPAHAAILLSLESVFAALLGRLLLAEVLSARAWLGCALILCAVLVCEIGPRQKADGR